MGGTQTATEALVGLVAETVLTASSNEKNSLEGIDVSGLQDRATCYVRDVVAQYRYVQASVAAPSFPTVIAPANGPGRWLQETASGSIAPLSRVLYVDGIQALAGGNGSIALPFGTIQEALDFIGPPANLTEEESYWTVYVINASPPEDLTVPPRRRIAINVLGGPTEVNSITWNDDASAGFGGTGAALILDGFKTVLSDIVVSDSGTATFGTLVLKNIFLAGGISAAGYVTGILLIEVDGAAIVGTVNAPGATLVNVINSEIFGSVTVSSYDLVAVSLLGDSFGSATWTVSSPGFRGMVGCQIDGSGAGAFVISGPAGCARMDGTTNYFFKLGGVGALGGAATKVLIDDQVP